METFIRTVCAVFFLILGAHFTLSSLCRFFFVLQQVFPPLIKRTLVRCGEVLLRECEEGVGVAPLRGGAYARAIVLVYRLQNGCNQP